MVDAIPVDVRIAVLDACASGSLTREKGGTKRSAFLFDASSDMKGHAFLTSSSFDEAAQESDRIKGSFFTHYLISAMRGGGDANGDGKVTLDEAYKFAFDETLRRTEKTLSGPQHAAYDIRLKGSGDLVMTDLRASSAGLRLPALLSGRVFIRDNQGTLLAELNKVQGKSMEIGFEPGAYQVTVEKPAQMFSTDLTLIQGHYTDLAENSMQLVNGEFTISRGTPKQEELANFSGKYRPIPFNLSFLPFLSIGSIGGDAGKIRTFSSISILAGHTSILQGIAISSGINIVSEKTQGMAIGAAGNFCTGAVDRIQIAGAANISPGSCAGLQIAGGINMTSNMKGLQIGVVNYAHTMKGLQIGVINICDSLSGVPIGLFSIIRSNPPHFRLWTDEAGYVQTGLRTGADYFYTIFSLGALPKPGANQWSFGYGLGSRIPIDQAFISIETLFMHSNKGIYRDQNRFLQVREMISIGYKIASRFSIWAGPSVSIYGSTKAGTENKLAYWKVDFNKYGKYWYAIWPGFTVGMEF
jgi:hypothetical protein